MVRVTGIGHVLGAFADVPHGHTSCVMLPHVMRFNVRATADKQRMIAEVLGQPHAPAADTIADLIGSLHSDDVTCGRCQTRAIAEDRRGSDVQSVGTHQPATDPLAR